MEQAEFIRIVTEAPGMFAWMLGAGSSQSAGLPTAWDIIWDLKRRYYCSEEHQEVSSNDLQNGAVREKIESYLMSRGFPATSDPTAYSRSFELIFGTDLERQSRYLQAKLSEKASSLTLGHRILGGLFSTGAIKVVFTTNFDTVVERAVAEVTGKSLSAFHLEGSYAAKQALNNDAFPIYCKLHGDFRYTSIKNLTEDLKTQNAEMGDCLESACNRFGMIVAGYSGRDESVMQLLHRILDGPNPFPHGFYWTTLKGRNPLPAVTALLEVARAKGVRAELIEIETFDSLMSRIWKQFPDKPKELIEKIGRTGSQAVSIPRKGAGSGDPILRLNALPLLEMPDTCLELSFAAPKDWHDIHSAEKQARDQIVATKGSSILAWGDEQTLRRAFGKDLTSLSPYCIKDRLQDYANNLYLKGFIERAIGLSLIRGKPLLMRDWRGGSVLILDRQHPNLALTKGISQCVGSLYGRIEGMISAITPEHPKSEEVWWAEAARLDVDEIDGRFWLVLKPDVWIWPKHARQQAIGFLDERLGNRFNNRGDALLSAWINLVLPSTGRAADHVLQPFEGQESAGSPKIVVNARTAFSRRMAV
ncbi:SIR2 family protein [Bradyrhizobium genosp. L]|uniref:SIR2 family protein n=1 Tax=Bradyrhizobium genosp. L TaxID=83637 RepID=UPI0018A2EABD|nr:SIR2 family protein [Bradyrhizobium genosp. L]QPF83471.1 SIR2 family protein [Bradyrhizobium genosp. L]